MSSLVLVIRPDILLSFLRGIVVLTLLSIVFRLTSMPWILVISICISGDVDARDSIEQIYSNQLKNTQLRAREEI